MPIKSLNPYLTFDGTSAKAIELYQSALGATAVNVLKFGDGKQMGQPVAPENQDRIMHAVLSLGGGVVMLSDAMPGKAAAGESKVSISLDFEDVADMAKKFDALAAGGKVTMPLQDTFWGAKFGMLTDAFGINWMFNCDKKQG